MKNQIEEKSASRTGPDPFKAEMKYENKAILAIVELCGGSAYWEDALEIYRSIQNDRRVTNFIFHSNVNFLKRKGYLRESVEGLKVILNVAYDSEEWRNSDSYKLWKDFVREVKGKIPLEHVEVAKYHG